MTFAAIKTLARRAVHKALAVRCIYDPRDGTKPVEVTARLHTKIVVGGDGGNAAYATIIEGVTRAIFDREELAVLGIVLVRNARVTFPEYADGLNAFVFVLDNRDTSDGPITEKWTLAGQ